jgi:hypothetical protein
MKLPCASVVGRGDRSETLYTAAQMAHNSQEYISSELAQAREMNDAWLHLQVAHFYRKSMA